MYKFLLFPYFLLFWFSIMILSYTLIIYMSQLQTQQLITSTNQVTHRIFNTSLFYSFAHFILKLMRYVAELAVLIGFNDHS